MKSIEIKGTVRTDVGKKATHELRKNNGVPCVLYGVCLLYTSDAADE